MFWTTLSVGATVPLALLETRAVVSAWRRTAAHALTTPWTFVTPVWRATSWRIMAQRAVSVLSKREGLGRCGA